MNLARSKWPGCALVALMDIRFGDHPSFHRATLGMVGGSAALGLALHQIKPGPLGAMMAGLGGIAIGAALGWYLDKLLGTAPWMFLVFFAIGVAAGIRNVYRTAGRVLK